MASEAVPSAWEKSALITESLQWHPMGSVE